jgi:hypothetical protein
MPVTFEEVTGMAKWKTKAHKKKSLREHQRIEVAARFGKGVVPFGKLPSGCDRIALDRMVDRFIREGSCRHGQLLGSPCASFDEANGGKCKRDEGLCDLLTEKGERYMREYG